MFRSILFASPLRVPYWVARFVFVALREGSLAFLRFQPGYHGSTIPSGRSLKRNRLRLFAPKPPANDGVRLRQEEQKALFEELMVHFPGFDPPEKPTAGRLYHYDNTMFGFADAFLLRAMLLHFRPRRVVEIGSGHSSALMLETAAEHLPDTAFTFVDPYSRTIGDVLASCPAGRYTLVREEVQDVDPSLFDSLQAGDILFIDTSHTVKIGSDLGAIFFDILPRLKAGVIVHIHDIYYPWEYPERFVMEGRTYNELYFVRAFLQFNSGFEILLNGAQMEFEHGGMIQRRMPGYFKTSGQAAARSLWLRRTG